MKKSYVSPELDFLELDENDVVRTSPGVDWGEIGGGGDVIEPGFDPDNPFA